MTPCQVLASLCFAGVVAAVLAAVLFAPPSARASGPRREGPCRGKTSDDGMAWSDGSRWFRCEDGRTVEDEAAEKEVAERESKRTALARAMTTRVLTKAETDEALDQGPWLFAPEGIGAWSEEDLQRRFLAALRIQRELVELEAARRMASGGCRAKGAAPGDGTKDDGKKGDE